MNKKTWLLPQAVFDGQTLQTEAAICIVDGVVERVQPASEAPVGAKAVVGIVSPGLIDLQVNGGGGVLFNATPTVAGMDKIAAAHRVFGTTAILPTIITDAPEILAQAVEAVIAAQPKAGLLGLHIEGPHISLSRRGTHAAQYVRPMDDATLAQVSRLRDAHIPVMITVAPEAITNEQISQLAAMGAVVSIGHSDATFHEARAAIAAGVSCATHLFNAMSPMLNRAPGVTGAVINSSVYAGLIVDGIHVDDEMIALARRARPEKEQLFLVSDAMPTVGGPSHFSLYSHEISVKDGRLVNAEGSLAGAHLTQAEGLYRYANVIGVPYEEALRAVITVPAEVIGCPALARIVGRPASDLIRLSSDLRFEGYLDL